VHFVGVGKAELGPEIILARCEAVTYVHHSRQLQSFLDPPSGKRPKNPKNTAAGAKGKGKHSTSFAYALLTHFTVVAAVTRRSERIAAK